MKLKTSILILAFLLCLTGSVHAQGPVKPKLCSTCGKMVVNCLYKGNHPKCATCGKLKEKCAYKGNHPVCSTCGKLKENCTYGGNHPKCVTCGKVKESCPYKGNHTRETVTVNGISFLVNGVSFNMIKVEGGTYWMGAQKTNSSGRNYDSEAFDSESPVHQETVSTFYMGETEVTQELWQAVMGSNPSSFRGLQQPVESIRWDDCQTFIQKLNAKTNRKFRLPTEAEWEYAARGGNKSKGSKYAGSDNVEEVAWYAGNSSGSPHPVKQKTPNELGLYDMSGNVYEWTSSYWRNNYNASVDRSHRVRRGSSRIGNARSTRVTFRIDDDPGFNFVLGIRLVLDP